MAKKGFELGNKGFREVGKILRGESGGMGADVEKRARRIAEAAGDGNVVSVVRGRTRLQVSVITATRKAAQRERSRRSLTRAADAGR